MIMVLKEIVLRRNLLWELVLKDLKLRYARLGSGINIKMLDYMSYGLPVVTTECSGRGINTNGRRPMAASSIDEFADNIDRLSKNQLLCKQMSEDAKALVDEQYHWKTISNKLEDIILENLK